MVIVAVRSVPIRPIVSGRYRCWRPTRVACSTAFVRRSLVGPGADAWIVSRSSCRNPAEPVATANPTTTTSPWTRTSDTANASPREWLVPSAVRMLTIASFNSVTRPVYIRVSRASSPVSSQVSLTCEALLISRSCLRGHAYAQRAGLHLHLELLDLLAFAPVDLVEDL